MVSTSGRHIDAQRPDIALQAKIFGLLIKGEVLTFIVYNKTFT